MTAAAPHPSETVPEDDRGRGATSETRADLDRLREIPDATRLELRRGQVLVYENHLAPGVFVLETGTLLDGSSELRGAVAVPSPDALARPAGRRLSVGSDARILFLPRSVVLGRPDVRRRLAALVPPDPQENTP